jgi:hypothetical protein
VVRLMVDEGKTHGPGWHRLGGAGSRGSEQGEDWRYPDLPLVDPRVLLVAISALVCTIIGVFFFPDGALVLKLVDVIQGLPGETITGRTGDVRIRLPDLAVSRRNARVLVDGDLVVLEDRGSNNGSMFNGQWLRSERPIGDSDII